MRLKGGDFPALFFWGCLRLFPVRRKTQDRHSALRVSGRARNAVIPAGMPESSAMDGNFPIAQMFVSSDLAVHSFTSL
ncbi:MAG: hypothetical protein DM484_08580 [Candidatus Methylumidiphilus alinenensis]|uniref:Uncharacterized protein n=1 Tax=Candidatus Methylumidiphilus alinenensis TaxID=2202197 RepID=A0A2W4RDR0_9GAMM|nr:MAG: hypothetical protein DM484_08580 [Candidatus Methylumidiphilus alinenensis]